MTNKVSRLILTVFVAHWTAHWWTVTGCPEVERTVDPYTGERPPLMSSNLMACSEEHVRVMEKTFDTKDEAESFLSNCADSALLTGPQNAVCMDKKITESEE